MEFDWEVNLFWGSLGVKISNQPYQPPTVLIGLGPVLLVFTGRWE